MLEDRQVFAFGVVAADIFANSGGGHRLVADFTQAVDATTAQASDLVINGSVTATSVSALDADTLEFQLPSLADASHTVTLDAGSILGGAGEALEAFSRTYTVASVPQLTVKHNPRLQPGNAPLVGFTGSETDRVDILWQTIPGGAGSQDTFTVQFRPAGSGAAWQSATLNSDIVTGVENRVVRSATVTGLAWNSDYEYRVRHLRGDVVVEQYQHEFRTRLAAGDESNFSFVAYGDSASGTATGFREVQSRINQVDPSFAVLLGDNVYNAGTHAESDARFSPTVNPEAATWMAGNIDYLGLGNHDVGTSSGLPSEQNFSVPIPVAGVTAHAAPPATERPEHSFSWDYGDVHFVTFDTNSLSSSTRLDGLLKWVVADLNASNARWKIVYGHHPLAGVPDKPESPSGNYYQQVVNRLKAAGVDLFMTGHSHTYSWTYPLTGQVNGEATYVDHGHDDQFHASEGLTQLVSGVGGVGIRTGTFSQFPFVAEGFSASTAIPARLGFSKIDVTQNALTVSYIAADDGSVIDSFQIAKEDTTTKTFQQGVDGYAGTVDTYLHQNTPGTAFGSSTTLRVDNDDPSATGLDIQGLLRFEDLFGSGAGQIPTNAILRSATLQLQTSDGGNSFNLHRMVSDWSASDTWTSRTNGIQTDGVEAQAAADTSTGAVNIGQLSFNVLASLQAWQSAPASNRGWAMIPTGSDGVVFGSSEGTVKPKLIVSYVLDDGVNDTPVANTDSAFTTGDTAVTIGVLSNDTDPDGDVLSVDSVGSPSHGAVLLNADKSITYTPSTGYYGTDQFSYTLSDGRGGTATALVNLTVGEVARFQQGVAGYAGTRDTFLQQNSPTTANGSATSLNVDSDDPAGSGLDVQALLRFEGMFGGAAGQIPAGSVLESATLRLNVTNAGNSVNLHRMLQTWSIGDTWSSLTNGVLNDGVEATVAPDLATGGVSTGTLSLNVLPSVQAWLASPATNHGWAMLPTGTDGIDFHSSEGTTPPELTIVYIPPTNSAPVAVDDTATVVEDTATSIVVLANDTDADGDTLSVSSVTTPAHGTAVVNADQTVTYTPNTNYTGADSFSYTIDDGQGGSATANVSVTVTAVNDLPVATNDAATVVQGAATPIAVLSNDTDADGDTLAVSSVTTPANGAAVLNADQTITYTSNAGFSGVDSFSYTIGDGQGGSATAQVNLTVVSSNQPPVAAGDAVTTNEDVAVQVAVLANDSDPEGATLVVQSVTTPTRGTAVVNADQTITYTPNANSSGADSFSYTIVDGAGGSATAVVTVTVNPVNDAPVANADTVTVREDVSIAIPVMANDTDPEGNSLTVLSVSVPANGTAVRNANGRITYKGKANYFGPDSFTYVLSDGIGGTSTGQVTVTVTPVNDAPVAVADTAWTTVDLPIAIPILANDRDVDGDPLTISVQSQPTQGTLAVSAQGIATYTPNAGYTGADSFTYRLSDGLLNSAIVTVSLSVLGMSKFYVVDRGSDRMYGYDAAGANMNSSPLGSANKESRGIATDATASRFWSLDLNKTVTVYDAGRNVEGNLALSGVQNPTGIAMAGNDLYVSDSTARAIHVFAGAASQLSGTVAPTRSIALAAGNTSPQDVATDGTTLWVVNSASVDRVYVYQAGTGAALGNWSIDSLNATPSGITLDPTGASNSLWIVDRGTDRVYEYANGRARTTGSQAAAVVFALGAGNTDPQGIADPLGMAGRTASRSSTPAADLAAALVATPVEPSTQDGTKACRPWSPASKLAASPLTLDPVAVGQLFEIDETGSFYSELRSSTTVEDLALEQLLQVGSES
jgi:hypothetical protein